MANKIHLIEHLAVFRCPGCGFEHPFDLDKWKWNGSLDKPTFTPSLLVFKDMPSRRCHCFVTDGKIQFLNDCFHNLRGQTMELPDYVN